MPDATQPGAHFSPLHTAPDPRYRLYLRPMGGLLEVGMVHTERTMRAAEYAAELGYRSDHWAVLPNDLVTLQADGRAWAVADGRRDEVTPDEPDLRARVAKLAVAP